MRLYEEWAYGDGPVAGSYWASTADAPAPSLRLSGDATAEIAVIGAGVTGLNAALRLARAGADVAVLDAADAPAWGASSRNGGFCCLGGAKADAASLIKRFGEAETRAYFQTERAAVDHVDALIAELGLEVDRHSEGETLMAHRPRAVAALHAYAAEVKQFLGLECAVLPREALAEHGMASPEFHGAVTGPVGFALNPAKYSLGLSRAAEAAGARFYGGARVSAAVPEGGGFVLTTATGQLRAKRLIIATNGYGEDALIPWMARRFLPVQSNILMSRPIREDEQAAQGWTSRQMCYDTRGLLHYFRLTPSGRMLFGLRGGIRATPGSDRAMRLRARMDFERIFPHWAHVETPHFWSGLACIARDLTPFAGPVPGMPGAFAAFAYHGNGVAMGSYCGALLADLALGRPREISAVMAAAPPRFELGRSRRWMLAPAYAWRRWADGDV